VPLEDGRGELSRGRDRFGPPHDWLVYVAGVYFCFRDQQG
jgi:hypothetical protein